MGKVLKYLQIHVKLYKSYRKLKKKLYICGVNTAKAKKTGDVEQAMFSFRNIGLT